MLSVTERLDSLESILGQYIVHADVAMTRAEKDTKALKEEMKAFKDEMKEFKDEMKAFKNEMKEFKDEMKAFKNEMMTFKDEMKAFKDEMTEFKREVREDQKERNKQWTALAKKMGTITEDLISPAVRPAIRRYFNCDPAYKGLNILKRVDGQDYEIDVLAVCEDAVFMIEVKSTLRNNYVDEMVEKASHFFEFFPEYLGKKLILIMGSIVFPEKVMHYASKNSIYAMAYREWDYIDILNFEDVVLNT